MPEEGWALVLPLPDEPRYIHGFEMGRLWEELKARPEHVDGTYHEENLDVLRDLAHRTGYSLVTEKLGDGWIAVDLARMEE